MNRCVVAGLSAGLGLFALSTSGSVAKADEVADFYKGKTLTITVAHQAGTGFDVYARAIARHLSRHMPGHPNTIVQNMLGAGGITAAGWLYNIAPRDGTSIVTIVHAVMLDHMLGEGRGKYETSKFTFIGNMEQSIGTCVVTKQSGITSVDDLLRRETIFGGVTSAGALSIGTLALINLGHAKIKLVQGYKGSADLLLAMKRGEVQGMCGIPVSTLKTYWRGDVEAGTIKPLIQLNGKSSADLPGVEHFNRFAKTDEDRKVFDLIFGALVLGRLYIGPPGLPEARLTALRKAFDAAVSDPAFVAEAEKSKLELSPQSGAEVEALVKRFNSFPPAVVARARAAIGQAPKK
jgi:tripartite-type tricarboxylate transporter receptor subunit TctC